MIPSLDEIFSSLRGMWRLLWGDADGLNDLNLTIEGFWRSFFVMVLIMPFVLGSASGTDAILDLNPAATPVDVGLVGHIFMMVVSWIIMALLMIPILMVLRLSDKYVVFITAWNWRHAIDVLLYLPPALLVGAGILDPQIGAVFLFIGLFAALIYSWWVTKVSLATTGGVAAGVVVVQGISEIILSLILMKLIA